MSSYTKNEIALINFQSDINKLFYYVGEEDDQVPFYALAKFCLLYTSDAADD